jgi:hypothetical protein
VIDGFMAQAADGRLCWFMIIGACECPHSELTLSNRRTLISERAALFLGVLRRKT